MKIIIDENIPFIKGVFEPYAQVKYMAGESISCYDVKDTDALIIRTRTKCNELLLKGSKVKYIASATIGYDHIDTKWCKANKISWSNAAGCNAKSVGQYVLASLLKIADQKNFDLTEKTIGIVGVGHVGSVVKQMAEILQMRVLLNDPPREEKEGASQFVSLDTITNESDIISLHTPLTYENHFKTYHLFDNAFSQKLKTGVVIINTSRGEVIDENALKTAILNNTIGATVIDVWENEPFIDSKLINLINIATPHIAGYSTDGKAKATEMTVQAISNFFALPLNNWSVHVLPSPNNNKIYLNNPASSIQQALQQIVPISYNIAEDDTNLRNNYKNFEYLRKTYRVRREFPYYSVSSNNYINKIKTQLTLLGFNIS